MALSYLKKGKAAGADVVINEIMISSFSSWKEPCLHILMPFWPTATFPYTLTPLHKQGSSNVCDNYKGIAVANCISILFLTILQWRLCTFAENDNLIPNNQISPKKGSRTADHILTLKNIIDKYLLKPQRQYLYACFVDFKAVFNSVWRDGLYYKLIQKGIGWI